MAQIFFITYGWIKQFADIKIRKYKFHCFQNTIF